MNLIVTDIDRTLIPDFNSPITEEAINVINDVRLKDTFCLSTGRVLGNVFHLNQKYNFIDYVIASNGAVIYDVKSKMIVAHKGIPREIVNKIIELTNNKFYKFNLCTLSNWYRKENRRDNVKFNEIKYIDNLYEVPSKENIYKCEIYYDNMDDLLSFYKELSKYNYPLEYSIMNNDIENNYIDITFKNINKGNATKFLKGIIGAKKVIAFGDTMNDYEMLKNADISISVNNANEALKSISNYVTDDVKNNGVINWLKNSYLNEESL